MHNNTHINTARVDRRKKIVAILILILLSCAGFTGTAKAELLYQQVDNVPVPHEILTNIQIEYQGHAVTEVSRQGGGYVLEVARDSEPHQLPYFTITYDSNWNLINIGGSIAPKPPEPPKKPKPKEKPEPRPEREEPREPEDQEEPEQPEEPPEGPRPEEPNEEPEEEGEEPSGD